MQSRMMTSVNNELEGVWKQRSAVLCRPLCERSKESHRKPQSQ
jgi:hypothetical protein